jgi:hypothetical protein
VQRYSRLLLIGVSALGNSSAALAQRAAPAESPPSKTSYQLIDDALAANRINAETAHKYRVFAAFGDSRLPASYRGRHVGFEVPHDVLKVADLLSTFSQQTQMELAPFFMRPDEPGSWITLSTVSDQAPEPGDGPFDEVRLSRAHGPNPEGSRGRSLSPTTRAVAGWQSFTAANGKAKVWAQDRYPGDAAKAQALAEELTRHIWKTLNDLMDPEPASDANLQHNGGDGALDFYLVHAPMVLDENGVRKKNFEGLTVPAPGAGACGKQKYIQLDSKQPLGSPTSPGLLSTAAHELMHAITLAYPPVDNSGCGDPWIIEATATWAESYVYPKANAEHVWLDEYLNHPRLPLDRANYAREYAAYLFPYFVQKSGAGEQFIPAIWAAMRTKRSLEAINGVLTKGWDDAWPAFLIATWNQPPVDRPDGYRGWDRIAKYTAAWHFPMTVGSQSPEVQPLPFTIDAAAGPPGVPYLSGVHFELKFDPKVRTVVFENTIADLGQPHSSVWGIQKIDGTWKKPEDWTKELTKAWCRDEKKENIEELIIVVGNSDWQGKKMLKPPEDPKIKAYSTGCTAWTSQTVTTTVMQIPDKGSTITEVVRSSARFEVDTSFNGPGEQREYWKVVSGSMTWKAEVTGNCSGGTSGSRAIRLGADSNPEANIHIWEDGGKTVATVGEGPWPGTIPTYPLTCPRDPPVTFMVYSAVHGIGISSMVPKETLDPDGKGFHGDYTVNLGGGTTRRFQYRFHVSP